ncbi:hypothetical protein PVK06_047380 [Gossypium arboreum]|uniref:Uncharacterized protein n=1 Tax=Gossypium arboreum TaxID=29729 RepID=A0ABR0MD60_GOSAR|nr:hypothetical protein PVK06_047380 [Gossypium arboreum]
MCYMSNNSSNSKDEAIVIAQAQVASQTLPDDPPIFREDKEDAITAFNIVEAWNNFDFLCRNYILNSLSNELYKVYNIKKMAKELWESVDLKYKTIYAGAKKFLVAKFLNFVIVDSKAVVNQV